MLRHVTCFMVFCSHSQTPVDELLGKPYQDEMLALIESYQDTICKSKEDNDLRFPNDLDTDELDKSDNTESSQT